MTEVHEDLRMAEARMYEGRLRTVTRRIREYVAAGMQPSKADTASAERYASLAGTALGYAPPARILVGDGAPWPDAAPGTVAI